MIKGFIMSLDDRLDFEEGKISASDFFSKTCCKCKFWNNLITRKMEYCHKCINNPKIDIKSSGGYSIEELYDYFYPIGDLKGTLNENSGFSRKF